MEPNELELLKKVLPEGFTIEQGKANFDSGKIYISNPNGEILVSAYKPSIAGIVKGLMEGSRMRGEFEGRRAAQHEIRTALGLTEVLREIRDEINALKSR